MAVFSQSEKKLGTNFQIMKYYCCCCKYGQDEKRITLIAVQFSIITQCARKRRKQNKEGEKMRDDWTRNHSSHRGEDFFKTPHHAFNGGLFPVGSALEVAPACLLTERCIG